MSSLIKMTLATLLLAFAAYVFFVEPNAAKDPYGASVRAANRLATVCERNETECAFAASTSQRLWEFGQIGWGLATGEGRLVYMTEDGQQPFATDLADGAGQQDRRYGGVGWLAGPPAAPVAGSGTSNLTITGILQGLGGSTGSAGSTSGQQAPGTAQGPGGNWQSGHSSPFCPPN